MMLSSALAEGQALEVWPRKELGNSFAWGLGWWWGKGEEEETTQQNCAIGLLSTELLPVNEG